MLKLKKEEKTVSRSVVFETFTRSLGRSVDWFNIQSNQVISQKLFNTISQPKWNFYHCEFVIFPISIHRNSSLKRSTLTFKLVLIDFATGSPPDRLQIVRKIVISGYAWPLLDSFSIKRIDSDDEPGYKNNKPINGVEKTSKIENKFVS